MGFADLASDAGLSMLDSWLITRSYIVEFSPSQADVAIYKAIKDQPKPENHPNLFRWYRHLTSYTPEFHSLPGDPSKPYSAYGPEKSEVTLNQKGAPAAAEEEGEDEDDLFGSSESEDEDAKKQKEANLAAYKKKKEGKVKPAAKSMVTMDVKPWDDETDLVALEKTLRSIEMEGLTWGAGKLVPLAFGIKKLQINFVVEDEKVSIDDLQAKIEEDEEHVQSTDVAAMMKL